MKNRILAWDGCINVRDLGGLSTKDGHKTQWKAIVRSDTPSRLTESGWSALHDYGIRTIITLRTYGMVENELDVAPLHPGIDTVQVEIEDVTDMEFVRQWASTDFWGTPLYYKDAIHRWPQRHAAVISAMAKAQPGGILFHCIRGHDRTGIIALLLLTLAGVTLDDIIADYELSIDPERDELLVQENTTIRETFLNALEGLDVDQYFMMGGASQDELKAVRKRLLG